MLICSENNGVSQKEKREDLRATSNEVPECKKLLAGS